MAHDLLPPSQWFGRHAELVGAGSRLLDVACGYGRNARFFAQRGAIVTAVDRDPLALESLKSVANVTTHCADLESAAWPYAPASFDAVIVCHYLWRPTFHALLTTVKPNGVLLYETFMDGNEKFGKPSRPDFLLRSNELLEITRGAFRVVEFSEGVEYRPNESGVGREPIAVKQRICARRLPTA